jgi:RNA recognition motif-containing protein
VQRFLRSLVPSGEVSAGSAGKADLIGCDFRAQNRQGALFPTVRSSEGANMSSNLYVGNLTFNTTSADLSSLFGKHGEVKKAQVITDRDTGRSRGFGFVEMASSDAAQAAISSLNGLSLDGRQLTVNLAKERAR